ncbi:MAG: hypothetical protein IPK26_23660 [Planctomycetes bacterium]|nr:hypothetical protein [Planctomycetota bacterium]
MTLPARRTPVLDPLARALLTRYCRLLALSAIAIAGTLAALVVTALHILEPSLPGADLLDLTLDTLIAAFPLSAVLVIAGPAAIVIHDAARRRVLLAVALTGARPGRLARPILALAAGSSLLSWWVTTAVAPEANYHVRFPIASAGAGIVALATAAAGQGVDHGGVYWRARAAEAGTLADLGLTAQAGANASLLVADELQLSPGDATSVDLRFGSGRFAAQQDGRLRVNAAFAALRTTVDDRGLVRPGKSSLLSLTYYRNEELEAYRQQVEQCREHGLAMTRAEAARADAVWAVAALRLSLAGFPVLATALVIALLARPVPLRCARLAAAIAVFAGLRLQVLLEGMAAKGGDLVSGAWAFAPGSLTLAVACGITALANGWRHAR